MQKSPSGEEREKTTETDVSLNSGVLAPEVDPTYERILDYGTWAKEIRQFNAGLPKRSQGVMDEAIEAFNLAEDQICNLSSERSHLSTIMVTASDVTHKVPHFALTREQLLFLAELSQTLQEAYEVAEFGDDREEKACLPPRPVRRYVKIKSPSAHTLRIQVRTRTLANVARRS